MSTTLKLEQAVRSETIDEALEALQSGEHCELPVLPEVAAQLLKLTGDVDCNIGDVASLGVKVTLLDKAPMPLAFLDPELVDYFVMQLKANGGDFRGNSEIESVDWDNVGSVRATLKSGEVIRADKVFVALGRIANLDTLAIDKAGLLKLVADKRGDKVLGVQVVGDGATELVHLEQMAIIGKMSVDTFANATFNFPTMAEAYRIAALEIIHTRDWKAGSADAEGRNVSRLQPGSNVR